MSRHLGLDFGTERIGVAISDEGNVLAFPYTTLANKGKKTEEEIARLCKKEEIIRIVLGLPTNMSGGDTDMTRLVRAFGASLLDRGLLVDFENEMLSSREAHHGPSKKEHIDAAAAAIILQSYLDRKRDMVK